MSPLHFPPPPDQSRQLILNLILICMGRDPLRLPTQINPEVGKLPHKAVDCIPLVLYIPAPAPKEATENDGVPQDSSAHHSGMPVAQLAVPELVHVHSYPPAKEGMPVLPPPESAGRTPPSFRRLFTFRRIRLKKLPKDHEEKGKEKSGSRNEEQGYRYEDKWERGDYPFVKLEGNRAACAICLCDFEEPKRVRYSIDSRPAEDLDRAEKGVRADSNKAQTGGLTLTDAGEGAQPLRLLACAHVFHVNSNLLILLLLDLSRFDRKLAWTPGSRKCPVDVQYASGRWKWMRSRRPTDQGNEDERGDDEAR